MGGFYSTPAFELFRRGLTVQTVKRFRGLNLYQPITTLGPEWALDLLNVVVGADGALHKMRSPVAKSPSQGFVTGPQSFWDFQQPNGTRQVFSVFGSTLAYFTTDLATYNFIEASSQDVGPWSFVEAQNALYGVNNQRAVKWIGTALYNWGIAAPPSPPSVQLASFTGQSIKGITFNGTNQEVTTTTQLTNTVAYTWELWFKTSATTYNPLVDYNANQTGSNDIHDRTIYLDTDGHIVFAAADLGAGVIRRIQTPGTYNDGIWHQVAVTFSSTNVVNIYVDGSLAATSGGPMFSGPPDNRFGEWWRIGYASGGSAWSGFGTQIFFSGTLSHGAVWMGTVLSLAQINNHYSQFQNVSQAAYETAVTADSPSYFWKMTEAAGPTVADSADANTGTAQNAPTFNVSSTLTGGLSPVNGYTFAYAWRSNKSGVGTLSTASVASGSTGTFSHFAMQVTTAVSADAQVDEISLYRSLDGGADLFLLAHCNPATGALTTPNTNAKLSVAKDANNNYTIFTDASPDTALDLTTRAPLVNNPPTIGKFVATGQGRAFIGNLVGAPQDVIYSGYEQIFDGNPLEAFPPNNRIRLSIGAEQVAGLGVLQAGIVAFSNTGKMFMFRGLVEDIVISAPINFTQYLEELPWTLGCASHLSIQATPYGLIWLAGDKTVQLFSGASKPIDISGPAYPLLRSITPGQEANCVGAYFNWLERDWYVLLCAVNGSTAFNRIFFWGLHPETHQIDLFISDIQADFVGVVVSSTLQRQLMISQGGRIKLLPISGDTVGGLTLDQTIIPATSSTLNAYWRSGFFGNDNEYRSKQFRWGRMVSDQDPSTFHATLRYVNDEDATVLAPYFDGPNSLTGTRFGLGRRAKRLSVELGFPAADAAANVTELAVAYIGTSDR